MRLVDGIQVSQYNVGKLIDTYVSELQANTARIAEASKGEGANLHPRLGVGYYQEQRTQILDDLRTLVEFLQETFPEAAQSRSKK